MTFRELLRQAQRVTLEAISNDDLPVEVLARGLNLPVDRSRNPLFTVATSLQPPMPALNFDWTVTSMDLSSGGSPWDLYLAFIDGKDKSMGRVQYNPDLFNADTVTRFIAHYTDLIQVVAANPENRISTINLN
jgi:non-ribosomal peptide synthetase component F